MGMSASQARYLSLTARKSNIEYQGQQINQERNILSQQCTDLYNTLLDIQVPTPPSTQDYTKVVYSGADGASTFTLGNITPHNGKYSIDFEYQKTGHYVNEAGTASATGVPAKLQFNDEDVMRTATTATNYYNTTTTNLSNYSLPNNGNIDTIVAYAGLGGSSFVTTSPQINYYSDSDATPATAGTVYTNVDVFKASGHGSDYTTAVPNCYVLLEGKFVKIDDPSLDFYKNLVIYQLSNEASYTGADGDYILNNNAQQQQEDAVIGGAYYVIQNGKYVQIADPTDSQYTNTPIFYATSSTLYAGILDASRDTNKDYKIGTDASGVIDPKSGLGFNKADLVNSYYVIENSSFRSVKDTDFGTVVGDTSALFVLNSDGTYCFNPINSSAIVKRSAAERVPDDATGASIYTNSERSNLIGIVADKECYTLATANSIGLIPDDTMVSYIEALKNAFPGDTENKSDAEVAQMFGVYFTKDANSGVNIPHFVFTNEVLSSIGDVNDMHYLTTYDYIANGRYTAIDNKDDCILKFDSAGRITDVQVPVEYAADGSVATYKTIHLSAETVTDNEAYEEAYNKYEYAQLLYDKKQQDINRKTEIIQQEDRNLEMKLTRLDNERKAVDTEMDAVKKVIEDNIDKTFKTFSG